MVNVQHLAQILAPWKNLYSDSPLLETVVTSVHLVGLLVGGGLALAADRATLRLTRASREERARVLGEMHSTHAPVLVALVALFASGVALAAADIQTFLGSVAFWVKLGLVALLLLNGILLTTTEIRLRRSASGAAPSNWLWRRLRLASVLSIVLWTATLVAGVALVNAA